ncbi:MAG: hypothetical protein QW404_00925 [Candidatus Nanoarchaeia archaeon]
MKDKQFNKELERILEFIYQAEDKARKESETQQIKYRSDRLGSNRKYQHNINIAEEKELYR